MHQPASSKIKKIDCLESLQYQGLHLSKRHFTEALAAATKTLDINDNGKVFLVNVTSVITLPAIGSGEMGPYIIVNDGTETDDVSDVQISVSPNANDRISGCDLATNENKDVINTLATARKGDYIIVQYGGANGWSIAEMVGTWAIEA